jgi:uncharacterized protein (DUF1684 family)
MRSALLSLVLFMFVLVSHAQQSLNPVGIWRGSFPLYNGEEIPFNFSVKTDSAGKWVVHFLNGAEEYFAGPMVQVKDSLQIWINQFDRLMTIGISKQKILKGVWRRQSSGEDVYPIQVEQHNAERFIWNDSLTPKQIAGKYQVVFTNDSGKQVKAIGLFNQNGNTGGVTFLRASGDSRYSFGRIQGNAFKFSLFIGYSPLMFTGKIDADGSITGVQQGLKSVQLIRAYPNDAAVLPNPTTITQLNNPTALMQFSLPNSKGQLISLDNDQYFNKPVILTIGGTWCPNCADEAKFLSNWYQQNKDKGIEVITAQFEINQQLSYAQKTMQRFREKFGITYEQVLGGLANGESVLKTFPQLKNFAGFPTTLFIGADRQIKAIHTGFAGPATGAYHQAFIDSFNRHAAALLNKTYKDQIEDWKRARVRALKAEDGWLNLIGLLWLNEGNNRFGSGLQNNVIFPSGTIAAQAGGLLRSGDSVWLMPQKGLHFTVNGKPINGKTLIFSGKENAAVVDYQQLRFTIIKRAEKLGVRLRHLKAPLLQSFPGIAYFDTDSSWRFKANFIRPVIKQQIIIKNALGQDNPTELAGKIRFEYNGQFYTLDAISEGDHLLIVMGDATSGNTTYAAGRFLYIPKSEAESANFSIDFNKAYNPPCVFTPFATCPIPPPQNILPFAVTAGEKMFGKH